MGSTKLEIKPLEFPLHGLEIKRWFNSQQHLQGVLQDLLRRRALVCTSPCRSERCDEPATRIFWQDQAEWYPCCEFHWPGGYQWTGSTRFRGGFVGLRLFEERVRSEDYQSGDRIEKYNRAEAC